MNKKKIKSQNTLGNLIEMFGAIFSEVCTLKKLRVSMKNRSNKETKKRTNSLYTLNVFQAE